MRPVVFIASPRGVAALAAFVVASLSSLPVPSEFVRRTATDNPPKPCRPSMSSPPASAPAAAAAAAAEARATAAAAATCVATSNGNSLSSAASPATSTTIITAEDIARAPRPDAAGHPFARARHPGRPICLAASTAPAATVDMRGFGAAAPSNTLVLVNGRRINDLDIAGVDLASIPRDSIERIEITRGNSGAVLYGDGAVGGVINIVTKSGVGSKPTARFEGAFGSFQLQGRQCIVQRLEGALVGECLQQRHQFRRLSRQQFLPAAQRRRRSSLHLRTRQRLPEFVGRQFASRPAGARRVEPSHRT